MKKLFVGLMILTIVFVSNQALAQRDKRFIPPSKEVIPMADCSSFAIVGRICQDMDNGKMYVWNGTATVELTTANVSSECNAPAYFALGTTCQDSDDGKFYVGTGAAVVELSAAGAAYVANTLFDAQTILIATADDTPLALTVAEQTVVGRVTGGTINDLAIDSDLTAVSATDDTVPSAKATKTYADLKAPIANPTFTGVVQMPNAALKLADTDASHYLIIKPGSDLGADRIFTITTGDAARTLTIEADSIINQDLSSDGNPSFSTINVVGANALTLGTSRTNDGKITFKSGTALNDFVFTITGGNFGADLAWALPLAAPGGANFLLNVDADGTMGYTDPATISGIVADCAAGPCLDGSADGGTYIRLYDGNSNYTGIAAGNSTANLTFTLPTAYPGASDYLLKVSDAGVLGYTVPSTFQSADATLTSLAALSITEGDLITGSGADAVEVIDAGATGKILQMGATKPAWSAATFPTAATSGKVLVGNGTNYVESTPTFPNASATARKIIVSDGTNWLASTELWPIATTAGNLLMANGTDWTTATTLTGSYTVGDADTDIFTLRSLLLGGNSRAVQITDSIASPTYATDNTSLYVKSYVESAAGMYAPFFDSVLTAGNVGYVRIKEDPTNGTNYRGIEAPSALTQDLSWVFPDGNPDNWDILTFGTVAANKTTMAYKTISEILDGALGNTQGNVLFRSDTAWVVLAPGNAGQALTSGGAAANVTWEDVTATAAGDTKGVQYNTADALDSEAAFTYDPATNTLNVTVDGANPGITVGDGTYTMGHTPQLYVEGAAEVDGVLYADGGLTSGGTVALGANNITMSGSIAATGSRVTKGWFTDIESTNMPTVGGTAILSSVTAPVFSTSIEAPFIILGSAATAADAGAIRLPNAAYIMAEADAAGIDISIIGVDSSEVIQIGASGASGVTITPAIILTGGITSTAAAWNLSGGTGTLGTIVGAIDAGGATSFEIVNGDNPTTDAAGEIAMDTTAGAIQGLNVYANATPGGVRVPFYYPAAPLTVKSPDANSDYPYMFTPYAITLRSVSYICVGGTSWTGQLQICDANYASCGDTQAADTTALAGTTTTVTSFSDATVPAGVWMGFKTTSVSGTLTSMTAQATYTMDQQ